MDREEVEYCLKQFYKNKQAFRFENGLQISLYKVFKMLKDLQERVDKTIELRKILNNGILDMLPFDIAEEVQDLFNEILKGEDHENKKGISALWFGDRNNLDKEYKKWVEETEASDSSFNVITFLEIKDLLDRNKVNEFLKGEEE